MLRVSLLTTAIAFGLMSAAGAATMQYKATLDGKSEVPPVNTPGYGDALATLDTTTKTLSYTLSFQGLTGPAAAAHFHGPAAPGANAGVVVPIGGKGPTSPVSGTATLTDAQVKDLEAGKWYANVHTAANPGGEIRGQLMRADRAAMMQRGSAHPMGGGAGAMHDNMAPMKKTP
jgi:hypothetical protein